MVKMWFWCWENISILGVVVRRGEVHIEDEKVKAVKE